METTFEKISRKTGMKKVECKCKLCKSQCQQPCIGTPEDMIKIIGAGYQDRVMRIEWKGGIGLGLTDNAIEMITPLYDPDKKSCTFFNNGLCELHDSGLKPTEGKLSIHTTSLEKFNPKKSIGWAVAKEWLSVKREEIQVMVKKYIRKK